MIDICIVTFELPIVRKIAAPALYNARNGIDAATINK